MKKKRSVALLVTLLSAGFAWEAFASNISPSQGDQNQSSASSSWQIAQGLEGQCRRTNRTVDVMTQPSIAEESQRVRILPAESQVILGNQAVNGWVQVISPAQGYVNARHLKQCPVGSTTATTTTTTNTSGNCRTARIGLIVRPRPEAGSLPQVGSVAAGTNVTLTGVSQRDNQGRTWYEISAPLGGWISGGGDNNGNLTSCS